MTGDRDERRSPGRQQATFRKAPTPGREYPSAGCCGQNMPPRPSPLHAIPPGRSIPRSMWPEHLTLRRKLTSVSFTDACQRRFPAKKPPGVSISCHPRPWGTGSTLRRRTLGLRTSRWRYVENRRPGPLRSGRERLTRLVRPPILKRVPQKSPRRGWANDGLLRGPPSSLLDGDWSLARIHGPKHRLGLAAQGVRFQPVV